jgi:NTE family protein
MPHPSPPIRERQEFFPDSPMSQAISPNGHAFPKVHGVAKLASMKHHTGVPAVTTGGATALPGQVVLAFQGGGALNAYQGGVYQALHEAGIEPDWVIGTSSGAINAGIIAGNPPEKRLECLHKFWTSLEYKPWWEESPFLTPWLSKSQLAEWTKTTAPMAALFGGVPGYYAPNTAFALGGVNAALGVEQASLYTTEGLERTMAGLTDPDWFNSGRPRLTVCTVNVKTGQMQYFDSARMPLTLNHVLASAALPISFPAVRITCHYPSVGLSNVRSPG